MEIAIKLGNVEELKSLLYYDGPFKTFELPVKLLKEKTLIRPLLHQGYNFNVHGITMYTPEMANLLIEESKFYLELCNELGCLNFVLHGLVQKGVVLTNVSDEFFKITTLATLSKINEYAKRLGIDCFLENGSYTRSRISPFCEMPSEPISHIELAQTLKMRIVFDYGHAALSARWYGQRLEDFFLLYTEASFSPEIIHLSDNFLENDEHVAIGEGKADIMVLHKAISIWPTSLLTIENFPSEIHKSLNWLIENLYTDYRKSNVEELCRAMRWYT